MQRTKYSEFIDSLNIVFFGFLSSTWKSKSINVISLLSGYFLFANFLTKFIAEGKNELVMAPLIILIVEFIIRTKPVSKSNIFLLWSIIDKVRIGATYAIILEAFKLGS